MKVCSVCRETKSLRKARLVVDEDKTNQHDGGNIEMFDELCPECITAIKASAWQVVAQRAEVGDRYAESARKAMALVLSSEEGS